MDSLCFVAQALLGAAALDLCQVLLYFLEVREGFLELLLDNNFAEDLLLSESVGLLLLLLLVGQLGRELALLLSLSSLSMHPSSTFLFFSTIGLRALFSSSAPLYAPCSLGVSVLTVRGGFLAELGCLGVLLHSTMIIIQQSQPKSKSSYFCNPYFSPFFPPSPSLLFLVRMHTRRSPSILLLIFTV